jgi:hypothetical protein
MIEEALRMRNGALTLEKVLKDAGLIDKWIAEGKEEGEEKKALEIARNLMQKGWTAQEIAETINFDAAKIRVLYGPQRKKATPKNR